MKNPNIPTASDLMNTAVRTVLASDDIEDVDVDMQMADIHHLPVLDDKQQLVGIVSQRDLAAALADPSRGRKPVSSIMTKEVLTVGPTTPADDVINLLIDRRIGCVPVVDDNWNLLGILTETDFLALALAHVRETAARHREATGYHR